MKKAFLAPILLCVFLLGLATAAHAETLSIGVSHSEYLPSVPDLQARLSMPKHYQSEALTAECATQQPAKQLANESMVLTPIQAPLAAAPRTRAKPSLETPIVEWFPIPSAIAGVWTKRGDLTTSVTDLRTGLSEPLNQWTEDEMTVTWGHQTDKLGNVWHANLLPSERDGLTSGKAVKFLTVAQKMEASSPNALVTRTHYVVSETYGRGGPVADIFQQEALNRYLVIAQGELQNNSTNRVFAYQGQPVRDGSLLTRFSRVGPFAPTPSLGGIDLIESLDDYLRSIGRPDLVR
jgi:hypothetical protein